MDGHRAGGALRLGGRRRRLRRGLGLAQQVPQRQQGEDGQQDQDAGEDGRQAEGGPLFLQALDGPLAAGGVQGAGLLFGGLGGGQGPGQLGHRLDAAGGVQLQAQVQRVRHIGRHGGVDGVGRGVGIGDHPLGRRDGALAADHPVKHRRQAVDVGVAAFKLHGGILLRGGVALVELAVQAAARRPQADGGVAGQPGAAVVQHPDVFGADAPVDQPHLVHGRHPVEHRLEHPHRLLGGDGAVLLVQPAVQGDAAGVFQHGVDGVVGLHHVQHRLQAGGRGDALDAAVQVPKVHPGGLEQHLAAGLGPQLVVGPALGRKGDGQVLLDGHPEAAAVLHAAVEDAFAVDAQHLPHRIAAGQQGAHRQSPGGVAPGKAAPAVGTAPGPLFQLGPAVRAKDHVLVHLLSPFR